MSKTYNIVMITLLTILILVLGTFLIANPKGMFKREKAKLTLEKTYSVEEFKNINIYVKSSDIYVYNSIDNQVKVEMYATKNDKVSSEIQDNDLNIELRNKRKFCFFCINESNKIKIYLPSEYSNKMNVHATSGDVKLDSFDNMSLKVKATSGDITAKNIKDATLKLTSGDVKINKVNNLNIDVTSGDIEVNKVNKYLNIEVTSGDIEIDKFNISKNSYIKATSGDVKIHSVDNVYVNAKVTSGDIDVNNSDRKAEFELKIKTTSGDISVN